MDMKRVGFNWKWWAIGAGGGGLIGLMMVLFINSAPSHPESSVLFKVPAGASVQMVAQSLKDQRLIRSNTMFRLAVRWKRAYPRAGYFRLDTQLSTMRIATYLNQAKGVDARIRVTLPEGFRLNQIAARLEAKKVIDDASAFMTYCETRAKQELQDEFPFLADYPVSRIEGYVFPSTYLFEPNMSYQQVVKMMVEAFERVILPIWETAPVANGTPKKRFNFHQVLTLASIIEKEARVAAEMPKIASVFYNRLKKMQPLGADPTVVYAMDLDRKDTVYYKDVKVDSPYNTYKYSGFPPTPIASPGKKAFEAAVRPLTTPYFFFVAARDGTHIFTRTYKEHLAVQRKR